MSKKQISKWISIAVISLLSIPLTAYCEDNCHKIEITNIPHEKTFAITSAAAAVDTKHSEMVIVGGYDPVEITQTEQLYIGKLEKELVLQKETADGRLGQLIQPGLSYDPKTNSLYLFGGWPYSQKTPSSEMWQLKLDRKQPLKWQRVECKGTRPPARNGCVMVFDKTGNRLIVHGGDGGPHHIYGYQPLNDLWALDLSKREWEQLNPKGQIPRNRWNHSGTIDQEKRRLFVFGGAGYDNLGMVIDNCIFELNLDTLAWKKHTPIGKQPTPVQGATLTYDSSTGQLVLAGGISMSNAGPAGSRDLWLFHPENSIWTQYENAFNTTRRGHVAVYDVNNNRHIIYGGTTVAKRSNYYTKGKPVINTTIVRITPETKNVK